MDELQLSTAEEILAKAESAMQAAEAAQIAADTSLFTTNNLWILIAAVLVFIMHLGFSALEAGFVRRKNVVNILFKNAMIIAIGLLTYWCADLSSNRNNEIAGLNESIDSLDLACQGCFGIPWCIGLLGYGI